MPAYLLPKTYDFKITENRIYTMWESNGYFRPTNDPSQDSFNPSKKPFVISIPPPNVTGELHLGHAMFVSVEDLMIRYNRMKGAPTLWVPGSDHAGIATQLQVEKALAKEGLNRETIGRDAFLNRTWEWKGKYGGIIYNQIRRLGASCDWERTRFTLDDGLSIAVREAFVHLYEKGLIYRGPRLINWSPGLKTAVSDLEVEYSEEAGTMYYFKYMLVKADNITDHADFIPVATTRPETILGDTAVAVHPEDKRYQHLIGREVIVPMLNRHIPVISDEFVEREFGTGALKITPGHDRDDYEIGLRHNLPVISILDQTAHINQNGGVYSGLDRFVAREKLWADMYDANLVIKEEPYTINVPRSQRGGEIIEPMVSTQWFVKIQPLADAALEAVRDGRIRIIPERFTKVYYNWLENIEDWCISRQLWWGHRIPVWYCKACGEMTAARQDPDNCPKCGGKEIEQDPDVLDTWFSSGLWPFSTLGWPEETPDYHYFYPTSVMETGYDILFFWVARMIMMGIEFTGQVPFNTVYLHGLIRDEHGRKMSKTTGNVIDPLVVMDEMGTDALRFTLLVGSTPGNDTNLSIKKVEANRNFANKIWNIGRFIINAIDTCPTEPESEPVLTLADSWIWARLQALVRDVDRLFETYQFGEAGRQIYEFLWSEFADWYVEIAKLQLSSGVDFAFYTTRTLIKTFDICLRMLHPFTPFVTEELWGHLKQAAESRSIHLAPSEEWPDALMIASWPDVREVETWEDEKAYQFGIIKDIIHAIRNLRSEKAVQPGRLIPATIVSSNHYRMLTEQRQTIAALAHLDYENLTVVKTIGDPLTEYIPLVVGQDEVYLPLADLINIDEERNRLDKELKDIQNQIKRLQELLQSPFSHKAPHQIVNKEKEKLSNFIEAANKLQEQIDQLG
jgi:valyl-tRNA synthetase